MNGIGYVYDGDGVFVRECKLTNVDKVKSSRLGYTVYALPKGTTDIAPPEFNSETQLARFDKAAQAWRVEDKPAPPEPEPMPDPEPSDFDRLEAQVMWTAVMTDTVLEVGEDEI